MNTTATAARTAETTYVKARSLTGNVHLAVEGSDLAVCSSGKAKAKVTPTDATAAITCKRCQGVAAKIDADRIAAAADTTSIDQLLEEATSVQDITAILAQAADELEAEGLTVRAERVREEVAEGHLDDAAAAAAPAAPKKAKGKAKGKAPAKAAQAAAQPAPAPAPAQAAPRQRLNQEELIMAFLTARRGAAHTPHEISKAVTPEGVKKLGLRDACARLARDGKLIIAVEKPVAYAVA